MGHTGAGTSEEQNVMDEVDVYFGTFAKAMAGIGAFVATEKPIIKALDLQHAFADLCKITSDAHGHRLT